MPDPLANVDVLKTPINGYIGTKPCLCYLFELTAVELHLEPEDENNVRRQCIAFSNELKERLLGNFETLILMWIKLAGMIMALKQWNSEQWSSLDAALLRLTRLCSDGMPSQWNETKKKKKEWPLEWGLEV